MPPLAAETKQVAIGSLTNETEYGDASACLRLLHPVDRRDLPPPTSNDVPHFCGAKRPWIPTTRRAAARSRPDSMTGPRTVPPSSADTRQVPPIRIRPVNDRARPARAAAYVLYWMIAARRTRGNFALERAVELGARARPAAARARAAARSATRGRAIACTVRARGHGATTRRAFAQTPARYFPYVEPGPGAGRGPARRRSPRTPRVVVTDDFPASSCRAWSRRRRRGSTCGSRRSTATACCRCARADRAFPTRVRVPPLPAAATLRARTSPTLPRAGSAAPASRAAAAARCRETVRAALAAAARRRCSPATPRRSRALPIDHARRRRSPTRGGGASGAARGSRAFVDASLAALRRRAQPTRTTTATSGLSPYLHFGHVVGARGASPRSSTREGWTPARAGARATRRQARGLVGHARERRGVPRRARHVARARLQRLRAPRRTTTATSRCPAGRARRSSAHARDPRDRTVYTLEQLERRRDARPAVERRAAQLRARGPHPQLPAHAVGQEDPRVVAARRATALDALIELNNKYALDGRDPNSYSGIFWMPRPLRPAVGAGAADLRHGALHEQREHARASCGVEGYLARYGPSSPP